MAKKLAKSSFFRATPGNDQGYLALVDKQTNDEIKPFENVTTYDKGHRRIETRTLRAMYVPPYPEKWAGVKQIVDMESVIFRDGKETRALSHGITSLSSDAAPPKTLMIIR